MALRLFGILRNAGCQELVNAIDWETHKSLPKLSPDVLAMIERL